MAVVGSLEMINFYFNFSIVFSMHNEEILEEAQKCVLGYPAKT